MRWGHLTWPGDLTLCDLGLKFSQHLRKRCRQSGKNGGRFSTDNNTLQSGRRKKKFRQTEWAFVVTASSDSVINTFQNLRLKLNYTCILVKIAFSTIYIWATHRPARWANAFRLVWTTSAPGQFRCSEHTHTRTSELAGCRRSPNETKRIRPTCWRMCCSNTYFILVIFIINFFLQ